jgi:translation initiation factor 2B subunit (eIF-2B alpha/beta/delta family)
MVIDSAANSAIEHSSLVLMGADAILKEGSVINKIGSGMYAQLAYSHKVPVYIATNSWKFSLKDVKIEQRAYKEVWKNAPEHIKISNPAFEKINPKYITAIISELGILTPKKFIKEVKCRNT